MAANTAKAGAPASTTSGLSDEPHPRRRVVSDVVDAHLSDQPGTVRETVNVGDRVVVKSGPWPERVGAHGVIVTGKDTFPFHSTSEHECVILLDLDPIPEDVEPFGHRHNPAYTCVISYRDLTAELW